MDEARLEKQLNDLISELQKDRQHRTDLGNRPNNGGDKAELSVGNKKLSFSGQSTIVAILILTLGVLLYYQGFTNTGEHRSIAQEIRVQTCVQSLSFEERKLMRESARVSGDAVLRAWCPWLLSLDNKSTNER